MSDILVPKTKPLFIRQEGTQVQFIVDGRLFLDIPWEQALELGRAVIIQARKAEELAKAPDIIAEQAILARAGLPFGFATRRDIAEEAAREAHWGSEVRRYLSNNIDEESGGVLYAPTVTHAKSEG